MGYLRNGVSIVGAVTIIALMQNMAVAKTAAAVKEIARSVTVELKLQKQGSVGSGIIIQRTGDVYTLVTNRHVVCGGRLCSQLANGENYVLKTDDGQQYRVQKQAIRFLDRGLDLAVIQFRSSRNYAVAQMSTSLKTSEVVYTAGFPYARSGFGFGKGSTIAVVNRRLSGDKGGYTVIYDAPTLPGMSGGGVFDQAGQLVAIHGVGDRYTSSTGATRKRVQGISNIVSQTVGSKIGYNRGIPVHWLVQKLGIPKKHNQLPTATQIDQATTADEYFISGFNQNLEPGNNIRAGKQIAIAQLNRAIQLNPKYTAAYFMRAYIHEELQDYQRSLTDYSKVIMLQSNHVPAYANRGILKQNFVRDYQSALADFDRAISLDPDIPSIYNSRGILKGGFLNDPQGALADYNQAIALQPDFALAYNSRAGLKRNKLNDPQGALADYNQAIVLQPSFFYFYYNRATLKATLKDAQGALADLDKVITNQPDLTGAYFSRALIKEEQLNDLQGAIADYSKVIALNPKDADAYLNRSILRFRLNDNRGSLTDVNKAIELSPSPAQAYYNRAILKYERFKDLEGTIADLKKSEQLYRQQNDAEGVEKARTSLRKLNVAGY
jgi:tetratricopeptide (TPR) repeat protein